MKSNKASVSPVGELSLRFIKASSSVRSPKVAQIILHGVPQKGLPEEVNDWRSDNSEAIRRAIQQARASNAGMKCGLPHFWSDLYLAKVTREGQRIEFGLAGCRVVTTVGVNYLVDSFQNLVEPENMRFHGIGTGTNAEAVGDTTLQTELTTQYNPDNTRATGTRIEGATANVYRTVGTNILDAAASITEHGIFSQAATGGGVLLDRTVFTAIAIASGEGLDSTYDLTITAGS